MHNKATLLNMLQIEKNEIHGRMVKLKYFIEHGDDFHELDINERLLLREQLIVMTRYYGILNERLYFHESGKWVFNR